MATIFDNFLIDNNILGTYSNIVSCAHLVLRQLSTIFAFRGWFNSFFGDLMMHAAGIDQASLSVTLDDHNEAQVVSIDEIDGRENALADGVYCCILNVAF